MRSSKTQEFFFATDPTPTPIQGPQAKAGSIIKGVRKIFLLKSLGSLFA
jgi:hypothetical protein